MSLGSGLLSLWGPIGVQFREPAITLPPITTDRDGQVRRQIAYKAQNPSQGERARGPSSCLQAIKGSLL